MTARLLYRSALPSPSIPSDEAARQVEVACIVRIFMDNDRKFLATFE
ncbi:MAG: hypothetical protein QM576_00215 [Rhodopseudomonas sp.]